MYNTARVSFGDGSGLLRDVVSNTVVVTVPLPLPVIEGFVPFNHELRPEDTLTVRLAGGPATDLFWQFTAGSGSSTGAPRSAGARAGSTYSILTGKVSSLTLRLVEGLTAGAWHVAVTATNSTGSSDPAEADFVLVMDGLQQVRVYPNPWRKDKHTGDITFSGLAADATVKIFTVTGHLVRDLGKASGQTTWDLRNESGNTVASGMYLYLVTDDHGNKKRGKLAIIR